MLRIVPSILSADFTCLQKQIRQAESGRADWIHCDIMDGHFVPNITFGPLIVNALKRITTLPLDVHLMIQNPENYIEQFIKAGADVITIHQEVCTHIHNAVKKIKKLGARAGVAIDPPTSVSTLRGIIADLDLVLIMSVNPGFGGQKFIKKSLKKLRQAAELIVSSHSDALLEVDGGIDITTAPDVVRAGANVLVAGHAIFSKDDVAGAVRELREAAQQ